MYEVHSLFNQKAAKRMNENHAVILEFLFHMLICLGILILILTCKNWL